MAKTEKLHSVKKILLNFFSFPFFRLTSSFPFQVIDGAKTFLFYFSINHFNSFRITFLFYFSINHFNSFRITFLFYFSINHFNSFQIRSEINHFKSKLTARHNCEQILVNPMNFQKNEKKRNFERFTKKKRQIRLDVRSTKLNNILDLKTVKCSMFPMSLVRNYTNWKTIIWSTCWTK